MTKNAEIQSILYESDRERIVSLVVEMGKSASSLLENAVFAFLNHDAALARKVVEDDDLINSLVTLNLQRQGFEVDSHRQAETLLAAIAPQRYDLVILDSPPVVPVSDPLQYVDAVDGVLYICMAGRTPRDVVVRGVDILRSVGANILGVVANNLSEVLPYYYDRKYYGYEERKAARLAAGTAGYAATGQAGHAGKGAEPGAPAAPASGVDAAGPSADEGSPASGPPGAAE